MRIGELATKAGVNIQSVRFYERRRILRERLRDTDRIETVTPVGCLGHGGFAAGVQAVELF